MKVVLTILVVLIVLAVLYLPILALCVAAGRADRDEEEMIARAERERDEG